MARRVDAHDVADEAEVDLLAVDDGAAAPGAEQGRRPRRTGRRRCGPCWLSRPTSSRPTWPVSTIRTTSMASGVVTRRPPLNSLSMPEPLEHRLDLRAAAVHDDGPQAGVPEEGDVLGEGAP